MNGENILHINVFDYLPPEKIVDIAEDELRAAFRSQFNKEADVERVLANLGAEYIFKLVEDELKQNSRVFKEKLREKCMKVLDDDQHIRYEIFRRADAWGRTESPAVKYLDEALKDCKPKVVEIVNREIENYPFYELRDNIADTIYECIMKMLFEQRESVEGT